MRTQRPGLDREVRFPAMTHTAPRTPAEHHYDLPECGLADLGRVGFDDAGRTVEVLVALTHARLAIAPILADADDHGSHRSISRPQISRGERRVSDERICPVDLGQSAVAARPTTP